MYVKNELLFDDYKACLFLQMCWRLLEFNPDQPTATELENEREQQARINTTSTLGNNSRSRHGQSPQKMLSSQQTTVP